jgi:hypothetical protein
MVTDKIKLLAHPGCFGSAQSSDYDQCLLNRPFVQVFRRAGRSPSTTARRSRSGMWS